MGKAWKVRVVEWQGTSGKGVKGVEGASSQDDLHLDLGMVKGRKELCNARTPHRCKVSHAGNTTPAASSELELQRHVCTHGNLALGAFHGFAQATQLA